MFKVTDVPTSIEELNEFAYEEDAKIEVIYKSDLLLQDAKEKYPEWYDRRIVKKEPKGRWICKTDLYDWWYRKIYTGARVGHRYYCLMCLCIYAIKCDIPYEKIVEDCYGLLEHYDSISEEDTNRFTIKDVSDALQTFQDGNLVTYPIDSIIARSGIPIKKNKRNYRKQKQHLKIARFTRDLLQEEKGTKWDDNNGRPTKKDIVVEWRKANPGKRKVDCIRETGLANKTVYKWWNYEEL